jgi:hypothetical protein
MIISDLNYLEVASDAFSVVGGGKKYGHYKRGKNDKKDDKKDDNNGDKYNKKNIIVQVANVKSIAKSYYGDATSAVEVNQYAKID